MTDWPELLERLAEPFPADAISWRAGATSRDKKRAQALPYAEPRVYEDRLNSLCPGDWSVEFRPWGEHKLICELTIHGVTRSSTGEYEENARGAVAQGTVAEAQAFKRACSKFGLGRYLYDIPLAWVDYDEDKKRLTETPELASRFLPGKPKRTSETLSPKRAEAMAVELEKLGFDRNEQLRFASGVLRRNIESLAELSEAEAVEVWGEAKNIGHTVTVAGQEIAPIPDDDFLSTKEAASLHKTLGAKGISGKDAQLSHASDAVGRKITSFTEIRKGEVEEVLSFAEVLQEPEGLSPEKVKEFVGFMNLQGVKDPLLYCKNKMGFAVETLSDLSEDQARQAMKDAKVRKAA